MAGRLQDVTRILFEPFHHDGAYDISAWRLGERLADALGDDRWAFRFAGPASLVYFLRALGGLVQYVQSLGAALDWGQELLGVAPLAEPVRSLPGVTPMPPMLATNLRLSVIRGGRPVVALSFGASIVDRLDELVPADLGDTLARRGIDVRSIGATAVATGGRPGPLFDFEDGETTVKVWLE